MIIDAPKDGQFSELSVLWQEAFGDTEEFIRTFEKTAYHPGRCRCITGNGQTIAALYWFDCLNGNDKIAYIYAVATAASHRGQGLCRALMSDTHLHLKDLGYSGTVLVPGSKELFGLYEKLGYRTCCWIREVYCARSADAAKLRRIETAEYADLRRRYLPPGAVIQEGDSLRFLKTMADFYEGEGFLLAARKEGDYLRGVEFLGDISGIPGIVTALDAKQGKFRVPGNDIPFAMYHPLCTPEKEPPSYFGLAFD